MCRLYYSYHAPQNSPQPAVSVAFATAVKALLVFSFNAFAAEPALPPTLVAVLTPSVAFRLCLETREAILVVSMASRLVAVADTSTIVGSCSVTRTISLSVSPPKVVCKEDEFSTTQAKAI